MCTVGGCMRNKFFVWMYVRLHYMWYYITHLNIYFKIRKLRNNMIDREHDEFNWKLVFNFLLMGVVGGAWWYSVFFNGFFVTLMWTLVIGALYGLWSTMQDMRG